MGTEGKGRKKKEYNGVKGIRKERDIRKEVEKVLRKIEMEIRIESGR